VVDSSLPVLVTRLPNRRALAQLLRAALRHEVAQVPLAETPRNGTYTLDLRVSGSPSVLLIAESAGSPQNGHFPLRLRPLHRTQAAELYALLEGDNASAQQTPQESLAPGSPPPDTIAQPPRTVGYEDSAPIMRAMSGEAPPAVATAGSPADYRMTARMEWQTPMPSPLATTLGATPSRTDDARRTAPSAVWVAPTTDKRPVDPLAHTLGATRQTEELTDDVRRTARSVSWAPASMDPAAEEPDADSQAPAGHAADDPSLSVSVVFEPDMLPRAVAAATAAAIAAAKEEAAITEHTLPADEDGPSLSVSVVFDPDVLPAIDASDASPPSSEVAASSAPDTPALEVVEEDLEPAAAAAGGGDFFFDEDFANMPMEMPDSTGARDDSASSEPVSDAPQTIGDPVFTAHGDDEQAAASDFEASLEPVPPPDDDDDDFATLIRLPNRDVPSPVAAAPAPAAGLRAQDDARTRAPVPPPVVSHESRALEELTPTQSHVPVPRKSSTGLGGRKKKSTHGASGRSSGTGAEKKKKKTRHPADSESHTAEAPGHVLAQAAAEARARAESTTDEIDPWIGRKIADGKYSILSAIGSGAAGAVYKATHRELRRTVAIKVLHPHYQKDPHFMKSFRGEALAASQLDHPNVMRVLDFGQEPDGLVYIVMEFLSGRTLQSLLDEERRLQPDRAVEIMIQVCAALSVAHDNGIIHRDIKPDNIMLVPSRNDEGGTFELVKVCDFGIAALQNPTREDAELGLDDGSIAGTPEYMSPEQARGSEIDARSDVYACGICLYELVTGRPPFLGENAAEILIKQLEEQPRPPSQLLKGLDSIIEEIILRSIQKVPSKRQQSARELRMELKDVIAEGEGGSAADEDERSIVENVPVLDDPGSGFAGFFIAFSSAVLRFGRFERGHPEASQAMKELLKSTKAALRGRVELTFARRGSAESGGFCVMTGYGEIVDLRRLLGSQLFGSFGYPFIEAVTKKGIASMTLREGIPDMELAYLIEMLLGPHAGEELRKELSSKPLRSISVLFVSDVLGRDRKLSWKVGLCVARLARDLKALSNVRGISLKKMREIREDLVTGVAHLLTKGDEVRQFLFNADLVDEAVANLRGFSSFQVAPLIFERLLHEPCVEAVTLFLADYDRNEIDPAVIRGYLRAFAMRLVGERSPKSDAAVAELHRRAIITDTDVPRDLLETMRATSLADALVREPTQFLRTLDLIHEPDDYGRELATLEAAMAVLARRGEAGALLAAVQVLVRHAKGAGKPGPREIHALRTMKSMIDKQRLLPIANASIFGPGHQREAARQLLVISGSSGAHALYIAREALTDASARPQWVQVFRETGAAGWGLLSTVLPRLEVHSDSDIAFVEDLLRAMPERQDPALGEAVSKFLAHPRLRPTALAAIVPLWGERARKPLMDALEYAEEPARIVAVTELRRIRGIDETTLNVIERLLMLKGSASDELRAACAAALADVVQPMRARAIALLSKGVEGKRGFVAMLRGDGGSEESVTVTEAMARALLALDRAEGVRAVKGRLSKSDGILRARLTALLQQG
jgi:serine/threonine-protein kinase